ncbi:MAG: tetratricopeptide repeat protein, partial [Planctomycetes bacterium]|nr:tetratricopeptide repeat protein [Planctomycetota bacterium]
LEEAEALQRNAVEHARAELGEETVATLMAMSAYGRTLRKLDRLDEAKDLYVAAADGLAEQLGAGHPDALVAALNCASLCETRNEWDEAVRRFADAATATEAQAEFGESSPNLYLALLGEARCAMELGDHARAEPLLRRVVDAYRRDRRPGSNRTQSAEARLARSLVELERYEDAEAVLLVSHEAVLGRRGPDHDRTRNAAARLVQLYERWEKPEKAAAWRQKSGP